MCSPSRWAPFSDRHCKSRLLPATWARRKTARPSPTAQSGRIGAGRREGTHCRLPFPNLSLRPPQAPGRLRGAAARLVAEVPSAVLGRSPRRRHVRRTFAARQLTPPLRWTLAPKAVLPTYAPFCVWSAPTYRSMGKSRQRLRPGCTGRISPRSPRQAFRCPHPLASLAPALPRCAFSSNRRESRRVWHRPQLT